MTKPSRKKIPRDVQASVLIKCRRRCCLCAFFFDGDLTIKQGQIAHLDGDRSNVAEDNLVFLCLDHHNEFDSPSVQGKSIVENEVRYAREELARALAPDSAARFTVTLEIDGDFDAYTERDQEEILDLVKQILGRRKDGYFGTKVRNLSFGFS